MIDIYTLSPYDLSAAICDELPLTEPDSIRASWFPNTHPSLEMTSTPATL
jgi:hypothetical protein